MLQNGNVLLTRTQVRRNRQLFPKVILNVGGEKHEVIIILNFLLVINPITILLVFKVMWRMLEKQPGSRLGLLSQATQPSQVDQGVALF